VEQLRTGRRAIVLTVWELPAMLPPTAASDEQVGSRRSVKPAARSASVRKTGKCGGTATSRMPRSARACATTFAHTSYSSRHALTNSCQPYAFPREHFDPMLGEVDGVSRPDDRRATPVPVLEVRERLDDDGRNHVKELRVPSP
jgi:hypothetical protein